MYMPVAKASNRTIYTGSWMVLIGPHQSPVREQIPRGCKETTDWLITKLCATRVLVELALEVNTEHDMTLEVVYQVARHAEVA